MSGLETQDPKTSQHNRFRLYIKYKRSLLYFVVSGGSKASMYSVPWCWGSVVGTLVQGGLP